MCLPFDKLNISVFTACKDRNDHLVKSINTWFKVPEITEVVIVDWSSQIPVKETLEGIKIPNGVTLKILRVVDQPKWILTIPFNLAAFNTTWNRLLKLDCDSLLHPDFVKAHKLGSKEFYTGNWKNSRCKNENHLNGIIFMKKKQFLSVGGYNEFIHTYGWDDSDLYERLKLGGFKQLDINNDFVEHLEHSDTIRVEGNNTFQSIQVNRLFCDMIKWGPKFTISEFRKLESPSGYIFKTKRINKPDPYILQKAQLLYKKSYPERIWMEPKSLYVVLRNGLGNRLRAFASIINLFKRFPSGWSIIIVWQKDIHCGAEWSDLFEPLNILFIDKMPFDPFDPSTECSVLSPDCSHSGQPNINADAFIHTVNCFKNVYIESASVVVSSTYSWKDDCDILKSLKPINKIFDFVSEKLSYIKDAVGVHIRIGQDLECDDISSWSQQKQEDWKRHRALSSCSTFIKKMKTYPLDQKFFIASDTPRAYNLMVQEFGHRILYTKRNLWDRSAMQIQFALIDVLLLSKCKEVLGSNWSSFTELATRLGCPKTLLAGKDF